MGPRECRDIAAQTITTPPPPNSVSLLGQGTRVVGFLGCSCCGQERAVRASWQYHSFPVVWCPGFTVVTPSFPQLQPLHSGCWICKARAPLSPLCNRSRREECAFSSAVTHAAVRAWYLHTAIAQLVPALRSYLALKTQTYFLPST
jgi:hypothetical protein